MRTRLLLAALALLGCGELAAPVRRDVYEWRLLTPSIPGPGVDTLSFHWDQEDLPVRVWVEDANELPGHMARAIDVWEAAFLYREFTATLVGDSTEADVIVRSGPPGALRRLRLESSMAPECAGATDLDVDVASAQLVLPVRVSIDTRALPDDPNLAPCLALTSIHELGHALGIFNHSPDADDIMFTDPLVDLPSERDQQTAETAYHTDPTLEVIRP